MKYCNFLCLVSISQVFLPPFPSAPLGRFFYNTVSQIPPQNIAMTRHRGTCQTSTDSRTGCSHARVLRHGGKCSWKFSLGFRNRVTLPRGRDPLFLYSTQMCAWWPSHQGPRMHLLRGTVFSIYTKMHDKLLYPWVQAPASCWKFPR